LVWPRLQEGYSHDAVLGSHRIKIQYWWFFYNRLQFVVDNSGLPFHIDRFLFEYRRLELARNVRHTDTVPMQIANDSVAGFFNYRRDLSSRFALGAQGLGNLPLLLSPF